MQMEFFPVQMASENKDVTAPMLGDCNKKAGTISATQLIAIGIENEPKAFWYRS
jgi:hypothetical protein